MILVVRLDFDCSPFLTFGKYIYHYIKLHFPSIRDMSITEITRIFWLYILLRSISVSFYAYFYVHSFLMIVPYFDIFHTVVFVMLCCCLPIAAPLSAASHASLDEAEDNMTKEDNISCRHSQLFKSRPLSPGVHIYFS